MTTSSARLVVAGLSGDAGKTIASLSILAALRDRGFSVSVFKKGPDYIDPAWLSSVSQTTCRNLDTYMVDPEIVLRSFVVHAEQSDISLIEGNRGVFDGKDVSGTHSTAQLAKLLGDSIREYAGLPVLGAIPKLGDASELIPGRHLGLVTPSEYEDD